MRRPSSARPGLGVWRPAMLDRVFRDLDIGGAIATAGAVPKARQLQPHG
jgi:hypothetical protein